MSFCSTTVLTLSHEKQTVTLENTEHLRTSAHAFLCVAPTATSLHLKVNAPHVLVYAVKSCASCSVKKHLVVGEGCLTEHNSNHQTLYSNFSFIVLGDLGSKTRHVNHSPSSYFTKNKRFRSL